MSLFEIAKKVFDIIVDFLKYLDHKESSDGNNNQNKSGNLSVNRQDDPYVKSLLHDNEIAHLKKEIDNLNKDQNYTDDEIRHLRQQVDILSKRCEELLMKHYEHLLSDQNSTSQRTPQNDNMHQPKSDNESR